MPSWVITRRALETPTYNNLLHARVATVTFLCRRKLENYLFSSLTIFYLIRFHNLEIYVTVKENADYQGRKCRLQVQITQSQEIKDQTNRLHSTTRKDDVILLSRIRNKNIFIRRKHIFPFSARLYSLISSNWFFISLSFLFLSKWPLSYRTQENGLLTTFWPLCARNFSPNFFFMIFSVIGKPTFRNHESIYETSPHICFLSFDCLF